MPTEENVPCQSVCARLARQLRGHMRPAVARCAKPWRGWLLELVLGVASLYSYARSPLELSLLCPAGARPPSSLLLCIPAKTSHREPRRLQPPHHFRIMYVQTENKRYNTHLFAGCRLLNTMHQSHKIPSLSHSLEPGDVLHIADLSEGNYQRA